MSQKTDIPLTVQAVNDLQRAIRRKVQLDPANLHKVCQSTEVQMALERLVITIDSQVKKEEDYAGR